MAILNPNEIFYTAFEPRMTNRFIVYMDGIPSYLVKGVDINFVIALLGFLATLKDTVIFISGQEIENELAAYSKAITCIVSLLFIVFSVKSFIKARKAKRASI